MLWRLVEWVLGVGVGGGCARRCGRDAVLEGQLEGESRRARLGSCASHADAGSGLERLHMSRGRESELPSFLQLRTHIASIGYDFRTWNKIGRAHV